VEGVLDEVQGKVQEIDERITKARTKVKSRRRGASPKREAPIVDAEIVDDERH
jgi:hypothetical protein